MGQKAPQDKKLYDILLVEDEEKNLRLLRKTLESADQFDCNITTAGDGKEGLEYIEEKHYDIVISDYQMPRMNGVDFLIKVKEKYSSDTRRFLITGHGDMEVMKQAINEAEIHQFIEKPWDAEELRATIHEVMEFKDEGEKDEEHEKKLYDILLVEDEEKNLRLLRKTLESADQFDCNITTAGDGKEALEYIEENQYDIVLSDYQMPRMNGVDFLNKVKEKYSSDTVRFLITGHGDMEVIKQAINEAEINQFIEKPWDAEELRATIHEVMELKDEREKEEETEMDEEPEMSEVEEALETIESFQKKLRENAGKGVSKEQLMFEFDSNSNLNNFSFSLKDLENVSLKNIERDEGKYIISVEIYPKSYERIR